MSGDYSPAYGRTKRYELTASTDPDPTRPPHHAFQRFRLTAIDAEGRKLGQPARATEAERVHVEALNHLRRRRRDGAVAIEVDERDNDADTWTPYDVVRDD